MTGVGLVRDERRGLASSINGVSFRLPAAVGPALSGWMLALGDLDLPLHLSSGLQLVYVALFAALFGMNRAGQLSRGPAIHDQAKTVIPPSSIGLACGFAAVNGVFFGFFPACRTSLLDPIDALRHEHCSPALPRVA